MNETPKPQRGYSTPASGWLMMSIPFEAEEKAQKIRRKRDSIYRNIYEERPTDERWVGDLGELAFRRWLRHKKISDFEWISDEAAGKPDFHVFTSRIGVKTVKRQDAPKAGYTAQITARHAEEPIDHYFFLSYDIAKKRMWFLGGITQSQFLESAKYYGAGDWVHPNYQIPDGHEIYNIEIAELTLPNEWLDSLTSI